MKEAELQKTEDWWNQLSEEEQVEINQLYDVEQGDRAAEENGVELVPIAVYGEFVEEEDSKRREWLNNDYWRQGFVEYLINHEHAHDVQVMFSGRVWHLGGTCREHPKALKTLKDGFIPANYTCPLKDKACPMRKLLSFQPGKSLKLMAKFKK